MSTREKEITAAVAAVKKKAKSVADDPWAIEVLPNNVRVLYTLVQERNGTLTLIVDRRRVNEEALFGEVAGAEEAEE